MKKLYVLFLVIGFLIIAAYLFVRFSLQSNIKKDELKSGSNKAVAAPSRKNESTLDLQPLFIARLKQLIKDGSKGLYDLSIDSMTIDVLNSTVTLRNVELSPDKEALLRLDQLKDAPNDVFNISFRTLTIDGINLDDVVHKKTIDFKSITIKAPIIEVYHQKRVYNRDTKKQEGNLYQRIQKHLDKISIGKLLVEGGTVITYDVKQSNKKSKFNNVLLRFHDILIDSTTQYTKDRFLFSKRALLSLRNYAVRTSDNLYLFKIDLLTIKAPEHVMTLNNVSLKSRYHLQKTQKELYDMFIPRVSVHKIDWWSLMNKESLIASHMNIESPELKIFLDRSLPSSATSQPTSFPNQLIMNLPVQVYLRRLQVNDLDLSYKEYNPATAQSGTVYFDKADIRVSNITNIPKYIEQNKTSVLNGSALFMRKVPLTAKFSFDLASPKQGNFSADIDMKGFEGSLVNSIAVPLGLFKVAEGRLVNTKMNIKGNRQKITGKILMRYNDLKLSLYEKEPDEQGLDKRGVLGFLANTFVIKNDNPSKNGSLREPRIELKTNSSASFCNQIWKTTLMGILETIGANPKMATKK